MKKKLLLLSLALILFTAAAFGFSACSDVLPENSGDSSYEHIDTELETQLKTALKSYFASEDFVQAVLTSKTTQSRLPLLYLKYVDGKFYNTETALQFKKYLGFISDLISDGKLQDSLYGNSRAAAQGWYGITDYLYSWSLIYNQYMHWCGETGNTDTTLSLYVPYIADYLKKIDEWQANAQTKIEYSGETITYSNIYYKGYNDFNNFTASAFAKHPYEWYEGFMPYVLQATGSDKGHSEFLSALKKVETLESAEYRAYGKNTLLPLWKNVVPVTQVAFGYSVLNTLPLIAANLNLSGLTPYCDSYLLGFYEKDENGGFVKEGGTPNWVGFSGGPVARSLYRNREEYDAVYEKTMQGYFPFTDGWNQPLDEMINLDRLCNYYDHTLSTGANVSPQYALLTAMMHGIDMENYKKIVPDKNLNETGEETFNVITMWLKTLPQNENGVYIIESTTDMAVAVAYLALKNGIEAPSPIGIYESGVSIIKL